MYCGVPEQDPNRLVALILAGEIRTRVDKNIDRQLPDEHKLMERMAILSESVHLSAFYSISTYQAEYYSALFPSANIIIDSVTVKGPLAGLFSFYLKHPETDVLLLSCDMIQLNTSILKGLTDIYDTINIGHDIAVYQHGNGAVEPIPGIYTSEALKKLYWLFASNNLDKPELEYCIEISNSFLLPIPDEQKRFLYKQIH